MSSNEERTFIFTHQFSPKGQAEGFHPPALSGVFELRLSGGGLLMSRNGSL